MQFLKKNSVEEESRASLEFLLNSMNVLKRRNPLSESFLMQLTVDIEGTGLDSLLRNLDFSSSMMKGPVRIFKLFLLYTLQKNSWFAESFPDHSST